MRRLHTFPAPKRTPHEAAAKWLLREESGRLSAAERACLGAWLDADPSHRAAWEDVRLAMDVVSEGAAVAELSAMRIEALKARSEPHGRSHRTAAAIAFVVLIGGGAFWGLGPGAMREAGGAGRALAQRLSPLRAATSLYSTAVGERSVIDLPDGSVATLDTDSAIEVGYTHAERGVRLLRGQALFEVAKHKPAPFEVYAGDERITAVGTRFDVRLEGSGPEPDVRVALLEGVVKVVTLPTPRDDGAPAQAMIVAAGEVLDAAPAAPIRVAEGDTGRLTSWRAGVLTFDDTPLSQAVSEMNRYTTRPIVLDGPRLASLRLSGVFRTGDTERFAEGVAEVFPIRVDHDADGAPVLRPRD